MNKTNGIEVKNKCIICGNDINGVEMICDDCKEAVKWAKRIKEQQEGTLKEPKILKTMCPHCGSFNTQYMYGTATLDKNNQSLTAHFMCKDCNKEFNIFSK